MLQVPRLREGLFRLLGSRLSAYWAALEAHIGRHLAALGAAERRA